MFALPEKRAYPILDPGHAVAAQARATQQAKAGNLSTGDKAKVFAAATKVLKKGK